MNILIDTHILLWATMEKEKLSASQTNLILDPKNTIFVSIVSLWEVSIKASLNKIIVPDEFFKEVEVIYEVLPLEVTHIETYKSLPMHHRDPFDRMLVAQAQTERLKIISNDTGLRKYEVEFAA